MSRPATQGQVNKLAEFGYGPPPNFDAARAILDQLKNNGWQPLPGGPVPPQASTAQGPGPGFPATYQQPQVPPGQPGYNAQGQYQAPNNTYPNGQNDRPPTGGQTGPKRDPNAPATPNQVKILVEKGYNPHGWTFAQASAILDQLKRNGWNPLPGGPVPPPATQAPAQYPQGYQQPQYAGVGPVNQGYAQGGYQQQQSEPLPWGD